MRKFDLIDFEDEDI